MKYLNYINYIYLSGYLEILPKNRLSEYFPANFLDFIRRITSITFKTFKALFKNDTKKDLNKDWLIFQSNNNYETLKHFKNQNNVFVKIFDDLNFRFIFFYKIIYIIPLFIKLLFSRKIKLFLIFYISLGYYEEAFRVLKKSKTKRIFFANDHNPIQRAFLKAANNLGLETFYFQHAHVTKYFPPLDFSVSFLDGQASYDIYKSIGSIRGKVELIGSMKFLKYKDIKIDRVENSTIGIALNQNDDFILTEKLIKHININFKNFRIIVRKHPRDSREIDFNGEYLISNFNEENVFNFLKKLSFLIAGNSSILLEAALINVQPIYYYPNENNEFYDYYGFVKHKLCYEMIEIEDMIFEFCSSDLFNIVSYFNESLSLNKINEVLQEHKITLSLDSIRCI